MCLLSSGSRVRILPGALVRGCLGPLASVAEPRSVSLMPSSVVFVAATHAVTFGRHPGRDPEQVRGAPAVPAPGRGGRALRTVRTAHGRRVPSRGSSGPERRALQRARWRHDGALVPSSARPSQTTYAIDAASCLRFRSKVCTFALPGTSKCMVRELPEGSVWAMDRGARASCSRALFRSQPTEQASNAFVTMQPLAEMSAPAARARGTSFARPGRSRPQPREGSRRARAGGHDDRGLAGVAGQAARLAAGGSLPASVSRRELLCGTGTGGAGRGGGEVGVAGLPTIGAGRGSARAGCVCWVPGEDLGGRRGAAGVHQAEAA